MKDMGTGCVECGRGSVRSGEEGNCRRRCVGIKPGPLGSVAGAVKGKSLLSEHSPSLL